MKTTKYLLAALIGLAGIQASAEEGAVPERKGPPPGRNPGERFKKHDTNGDGKLSLEEFKAGAPEGIADKADEIFKKIDTDGDGSVDKKEMKAHIEKRMEDAAPGERFAKRDSNGDGKLSLEEFTAGAPEQAVPHLTEAFKKIDANADGFADKDEMKAHIGKRPEPGEAGERFKKRDTNGDGKLGADEFAAGAPEGAGDKAGEIFKKMDRNGDGFLTPDELRPPRMHRPEGEGRPRPGKPGDEPAPPAEKDPGAL